VLLKTHSEDDIEPDLLKQIKSSAYEALLMLELDSKADPETVVSAVDQFVYNWQCGKCPSVDCSPEDLPYTLGSLWGDQLERQLAWQWKKLTIHEHGDARAPGVVSPDRSMVIYPIHFIIGCLQAPSVDAAILLSFKMLKGGKSPHLSKGAYGNVMEHVFRIIPRFPCERHVE
jgi:hypothetical protein